MRRDLPRFAVWLVELLAELGKKAEVSEMMKSILYALCIID